MKSFLKVVIHNRKAIIKWVAIAIVAVVAFQIAHNVATAERGYEAIGGEMFAPLLVIFAKDIWKMVTEPFKVIKEILGESK